jgi:hypothetical protein
MQIPWSLEKKIGVFIPMWDLKRGIRNSKNSLPVRVLSNKQIHCRFLNEFAIKVEVVSSANLNLGRNVSLGSSELELDIDKNPTTNLQHDIEKMKAMIYEIGK